MGKAENAVRAGIRLAIANVKRGILLWPNPVGFAYTQDGSPIRFGLKPGSGDEIGLRSFVITPDMVGKRIAQFVSVESKTSNGRARVDQKLWRDLINHMGGYAVIVHSVEEAERAFVAGREGESLK